MVAKLNHRGNKLALLQLGQVTAGLLGQVILLARWSPHAQTDLFLLVSSIPWLVSAGLLVGSLELAIPALYHRILAHNEPTAIRYWLAMIYRVSLSASSMAVLISMVIIAYWVTHTGYSITLALWMGIALSIQVIPATLGSIWRGVLVAQDQLAHVQIVLGTGSVLTVLGYGLIPGPPGWGLPLVTIGAASSMAFAACWFYRKLQQLPAAQSAPPNFAQWTELKQLIRMLAALSVAAGLFHLQVTLERAAIRPVATGAVAALTVANRGWAACTKVIVAASVLPAYPRWATYHAHRDYASAHALLAWSWQRTMLLSLAAASVIGIGAWQLGSRLAVEVGWQSGKQAVQMVLVLLPRFVLVSSIQPLVQKHYAIGTPWYPVLGSALGIGGLVWGAWLFVPRWELLGFLVATTISVIPGWLLLGWTEWMYGKR